MKSDRAALERFRDQLRSEAEKLGFDALGVAPAVPPPHYGHFLHWIAQGYHGQMQYMARHAAARADLDRILPGTRSVVVVLKSYHDPDANKHTRRISRYAVRADYHDVLRERLRRLAARLTEAFPEARCRAVVDTAPLLERDYAWLAGLGWIGKNTMLLNRRWGSWTFLGALLTTLPLPPDQPYPVDHCGSCTRCLDACPTHAFLAPRLLDATRCIAYWTIEHKGPLPQEGRGELHGWLFGCDICQEVCPWNRKAQRPAVELLPERADLRRLEDAAELLERSDGELAEQIAGTPLERAGPESLKRNAAYVLARCPEARAEAALQKAAEEPSEVVQDAARWALAQLKRHPTVSSVVRSGS